MPLSWNEIKDRALAFSREWAQVASEDAEAKSFWDDFFNVFGVSRRRTASFERKVKKIDGKDGYIDLLWKGVVLVEHKSRGKDLDRAYQQARDYFPGLMDVELPRYIVVSDFARFRIHDLETGEQHQFPLQDLHKQVRRFAFIAGYQTHTYKEQDPINLKAAERMGRLYDRLKLIGYDGHPLQVLLVRVLFCLFAEDTGIFERAQFMEYLTQRTGADGSDVGTRLAELFQVLNTPPERRMRTLDEQLAAFPYINGALFGEFLPIAAFDGAMRDALLDACALDWSGISPAIFGGLFQSVMDDKARRNLGAHYTSEKNILKLIGPLFLDELRAEFERIKGNRARLLEFHSKLRSLTFLDPACGCGNFLVIAYRELRLLELDVLRASTGDARSHSLALDLHGFLSVGVDQFYGIEIEEFPSQIAQVALWLIDHQMNLKVSEEFGQYFARIPLTSSPHIVNGNALRLDWEAVVPRERLSYILGNPPFKGHHLQSEDEKRDMLACFGEEKAAGVMDFVTAWYCKAATFIRYTPIKVAFVSTNSITQGEQVGILWRALQHKAPVEIHFAHRTFRWSNEARGVAAVFCVIIGFAAHNASDKIIYAYDTVDSDPHAFKATQINAYLVDAPWVLLDNRASNPFGMPEMMYGSKPTDNGHFLFTDDEAKAFLAEEPDAAKFIKPFLSAHEYLHNEKRWVLWLFGAAPDEINRLPKVKERVQSVNRFRKASKAASTRAYPYPTLFRQVTQPRSEYVLIPGHTSENRAFIPFGFFPMDHIVGNSCFSLPGATRFHFGVIQASMHMAWVRYTCGRLKSDFRYSKDIVYNNFPWPMDATDKQKDAIETAAQGVLDARARFPDSSLADLYDPLTMPSELVRAHQALDRAVDAAYVPSGGKKNYASDAERVAFLFDLYQRLTSLLPAVRPKKTRQKN
ncbi:DNA methyltransferase [Immundisolibacter cernigliae]|uniref:site-specific DNA-methyltransferase (adenine-specific) n=1 Tax=Immundisolibacter cernigliae TaxID=1810504 RepID=A0A1B1YVR2_9GAMM|nr:DNA methyltransferase [Immundisolibacter cernigliae]ANX04862.1 methylase [Immundisolibacter cernigliae]